MDISLNGPDSLLLIVIIAIVIVVIIAIAFFMQRSAKKKSHEHDNDTSALPTGLNLAYQPEAKPRLAFASKIKAVAFERPAGVPQPKEIDLIATRKDFAESVVALGEKYSLDSFTLATADGLVFGSSGGDAAQIDAATYSELFKNNPLAVVPGLVLFGLTHKGSELIGIIRTKTPLPEEIVGQVKADTKVILNRWI
jgi:hypothetical protein